jgi:enoyl-CoA hydratase
VPPVTYAIDGRVAVITIDRPERRNAVDRETAEALADAFTRFDADPEADVAVLTGAGGDFSAGADLKAFDLIDRPGGYLGFTRTTVGKPTIAAVEGHCVAGGLEMALWCDLRVAAVSAVFGCFERRFGVPLVDGGTQRLPRIVGHGLAMEMILTGRPVDSAEAHAVGLVNLVVADGDALSAALALAGRIASFPQDTLRSDRLALLEGDGRGLAEGLAIERARGLAMMEAARLGAARFAAGEGRSGQLLAGPVGMTAPPALQAAPLPVGPPPAVPEPEHVAGSLPEVAPTSEPPLDPGPAITIEREPPAPEPEAARPEGSLQEIEPPVQATGAGGVGLPSPDASGPDDPLARPSGPARLEVEVGRPGFGVTFPAGIATVGGYLSRPVSGRGKPLLVVHDRWGLTPEVLDGADRLARLGYVVLAPDLYEGRVAADADQAAKLADEIDEEVASSVLEGAMVALVELEGVFGEGVGVVGLGMGGSLAIWLSTVDPRVRAVVSFEAGGAVGGFAPRYREAVAAFLGHDAADPAGAASTLRLEMQLRDFGLDATFYAYRSAVPGFWDRSRPDSYDARFADLAWERTRLFLARVL